jgi:hypothetical protein
VHSRAAGVIYDSQAAIRKWRGLPVRAPLPASLLLPRESYMTPSRPKYTKIQPNKGGSSYFLSEKSPKTAFFLMKTFKKDIILILFERIDLG